MKQFNGVVIKFQVGLVGSLMYLNKGFNGSNVGFYNDDDEYEEEIEVEF